MNCVDYLLQEHTERSDNFILGRGSSLSYRDLADGVAKLSAWFEQAVGTGNNIILMMPNSHYSVISYLAIMKSGNVVVPLNPQLEKAGFEDIIMRCGAQYAVLSRQVEARIKPDLRQVLTEPNLDELLKAESHVPWQSGKVGNDKLAQIIFTSGSTALPKGVMISHRNIMANTQSIIDYLHLTSADVMEVVLPFFYCYGLSLLHTHLKVGGAIVLNNTFILLNSVIEDLMKYRCTGFAGVPSHFQILLRKTDAFKNSSFPALRYVTQAGGKLHTAFIEEFQKHQPNILFYVMYGQTEATARLSYLPPDRLKDKLGSLGKGIPDVTLKVVNEQGESVAEDEVGEIIAQGDNVMLGYYQDPEETAHTLRDGWLYTGDLARVDADGFIYHAARKKEIIKVGGRRVSPKEIEAVIVGLDGVVDCTISAQEDIVLGEAIKATVVINPDDDKVTESALKMHCAQQLVSYKIPQIFEFTQRLNFNAAGKKVKVEK
ncbi:MULTISPECIES: class I adenylate-forming enzyme family protein [unclassified Carboxylicivirga]|uniref:class I adenylate-forming enzyme family protein n=1 Tax=Carboxylicivirga TaxID=1628153 RepID=UPI003D357F51